MHREPRLAAPTALNTRPCCAFTGLSDAVLAESLHEVPPYREFAGKGHPVRLGKTVAECGFALLRKARQYLRSRATLADLFLAGGRDARIHLRKLTYVGTLLRFPEGLADKVRDQIEHKLRIIAQLSY
jgi:hypothetical protein